MGIWRDPSSKNAFVLSVFSVLFTVVAALVGIGFYLTAGSALCLVFGLENMVDLLSSVVVLWRFFSPGKLTPEREELLQQRELRASTAISFVLILLGVGVISTSSWDLAKGASIEFLEMELIVAIAFFSILVFGTLTIFKFHYASALDSNSLHKDGVCSLIGTVLAVALFINTLIIRKNSNLWWLDPLVAMLCGFVALSVGFHSILVLCKRGVPLCSLSWWFTSRGDGKDSGDPSTRPSSEDGTSDLEMSESKPGDTSTTSLSNEVV
jgi:divalent metal cation (Fe/Co/Zn/Cd) transporter